MIAIQSWFVIMMFDLKMILLSAIKEILDGQNHDNQLHWLSSTIFSCMYNDKEKTSCLSEGL